jgi:hypothetical protein
VREILLGCNRRYLEFLPPLGDTSAPSADTPTSAATTFTSALSGGTSRPTAQSLNPCPVSSHVLVLSHHSVVFPVLSGYPRPALCKPFLWNATAESIIEMIARLCGRIDGAGHYLGRRFEATCARSSSGVDLRKPPGDASISHSRTRPPTKITVSMASSRGDSPGANVPLASASR